MKAKQIRLIFGIVLSISLVVAGICLMGACLTLYRTGGEEPYTAQRVVAYWKPIALPVYIALALVVVSFIVNAVLPPENKKQKVEKNYPLMLKKLHEKNDLNGCGDEKLVAAIRAEQKKRNLHRYITLGLLALGFVVMLCYSLNMGNVYDKDSTPKIMKLALLMLICFGVPFGYSIFYAYFQKASIVREWELMKLVASPRKEPLCLCKKQPKYLSYIPYAGIVLAIVLIVVGYLGGGQNGVVEKAVEICKECVGIG